MDRAHEWTMLPPIASRFIAGETEAGALDRVRALNDRGIGAILNRLGEHYDEPSDAAEDTAAYIDMLEALAEESLRGCISVKPSQVGLDIDEDLFVKNLEAIVARAAELDQFVWLDMEDHTTTEATIQTFETVANRYPHCLGIALQANLKRTAEDLQRLSAAPGEVRLVKGAYDPPADLAYRSKERVDDAYLSLLEVAFHEYEGGIAIGTHDTRMIDRAIELQQATERDFEIQRLMGVRESFQTELADDHDVWQYVPYGGSWLSYFSRRVTERKENLLFALRAILGW